MIRHIDNIEIPTNGTWPATGESSVVRTTRRRGRHAVPVRAGWFDIAEDPAASSLRLDLDDFALCATGPLISTDRNGKSEWRFEGGASSGTRHEPLTLALSYHGVFRRGADAWMWLSGTGAIGAPATRRARRRSPDGDGRIVLELLFTRADLGRQRGLLHICSASWTRQPSSPKHGELPGCRAPSWPAGLVCPARP